MRGAKQYYPMMVDLTGKRCLVVGGGQVAERKISSLLETGAVITVVSPDYTPKIQEWVETGKIEGEYREYTCSDGEGAFVIFASANDDKVNENVRLDAVERNQLVNAAHNGDRGNFILPAVYRNGKLLISVATSGASPLTARQIRDDIADRYGSEYETYLDFLAEFRIKVKQAIASSEAREQIFRKMMQLDILRLIRTGKFERYQAAILDMLVQDGPEQSFDRLAEEIEQLLRTNS